MVRTTTRDYLGEEEEEVDAARSVDKAAQEDLVGLVDLGELAD